MRTFFCASHLFRSLAILRKVSINTHNHRFVWWHFAQQRFLLFLLLFFSHLITNCKTFEICNCFCIKPDIYIYIKAQRMHSVFTAFNDVYHGHLNDYSRVACLHSQTEKLYICKMHCRQCAPDASHPIPCHCISFRLALAYCYKLW